MKNALSLFFLLLLLGASPASAQNIWPVSFSYWFGCPDRYMPDLQGADHSIAHARDLDRLGVDELRGVMSHRNQAMSLHELGRYNIPSMLPAIYTGAAGSDSSASPPASAEPSPSAPPSEAAAPALPPLDADFRGRKNN
jgi:hypothetical protein